MDFSTLLISSLFCGFLGVIISKEKSRLAGFFLGLILGPLGLLIAIAIRLQQKKDKQKTCLFCKKSIHVDALKCPYCQSDLSKAASEKPL